MSVFVSWSGARGRLLAAALSDLTRSALPDARTWMSTEIQRGTPWASALFSNLGEAKTCIACLTADSLRSPWIPFEAGAIVAASSGEATIARLSFDVPVPLLERATLVDFPTFTCERSSIAEMLKLIGDSEQLATPSGEAVDRTWPEFEACLSRIPALVPRAFELVTWGPGGLVRTEIDLDQDFEWTALLESLTATESFSLPKGRWSEIRYLDMKAMRWLPAPSRLSEVTLARLVVLHPDLEAERLDSARLSATMLSQSLDVIPAAEQAHATLTRDLEALIESQRRYESEHGRYASSLEELRFFPAFGNEIELVTGPNGWAARATRAETAMTFGVRVGDGAGSFSDREEYEVFAM